MWSLRLRAHVHQTAAPVLRPDCAIAASPGAFPRFPVPGGGEEVAVPPELYDVTDAVLSLELWEALGRPARLPPGLYWEQGGAAGGRGWELQAAGSPLAADGTRRRAYSGSELTRMLPGRIDTPERVFYGIMIWSEGVYELKYESMSIKGYRPEPYTHLWKFIYPSPMQQPSEVLCKARMLLHLLREGYLAPAAALSGLQRQSRPTAAAPGEYSPGLARLAT